MANPTPQPGALPIVVSICGPADLTERDADRARPSLVRQLRRLKRRYAHSSFAVATDGSHGLQHLASAAAAEVDGLSVAGECCATCDLSLHVESAEAGGPDTRVRLERRRRRAWDDRDELRTVQLEHADTYNRDAARQRAKYADRVVASERALVMPEGVEPSFAAARLRDIFATADSLAARHQVLLYAAFALVTGLGLIATVLLALLHVLNAEWARYWFVLFVGLAFAAWYVAKRLRIHERYIEYRALAESARIQFYWHACGIGESTRDHCSNQMPQRLAWVQQALLSIMQVTAPRTAAAPDAPRTAAILQAWVDDQARYFLRTWRTARARYRLCHRAAMTLYVIAALAEVANVLTPGSLMQAHKPLEHALSLTAVILLALATIIMAYVTKIATVYQVQHYRRMSGIYAEAQQKLVEPSAPALHRIAVDLGRQALHENAQWAAVLTQQPIDPPPSPFTKPWHDSDA